jgi:hypothetical protein
MKRERLKEIIFKKLNKDLSKVQIIDYQDSIWFIDRSERYWYFEYRKSDGFLFWRFSFFNDFFTVFGFDATEFEPYLIDWVQTILNSKINVAVAKSLQNWFRVEEAIYFGGEKAQDIFQFQVAMSYDMNHISSPKIEKLFDYANHICVTKVLGCEIFAEKEEMDLVLKDDICPIHGILLNSDGFCNKCLDENNK